MNSGLWIVGICEGCIVYKGPIKTYCEMLFSSSFLTFCRDPRTTHGQQDRIESTGAPGTLRAGTGLIGQQIDKYLLDESVSGMNYFFPAVIRVLCALGPTGHICRELSKTTFLNV